MLSSNYLKGIATIQSKKSRLNAEEQGIKDEYFTRLDYLLSQEELSESEFNELQEIGDCRLDYLLDKNRRTKRENEELALFYKYAKRLHIDTWSVSQLKKNEKTLKEAKIHIEGEIYMSKRPHKWNHTYA